MPDSTMEFCSQDPKRGRQLGLGVAIVGVGLGHSRPLTAVRVQLPGSVSRSVMQLSRAGIRCGTIPGRSHPLASNAGLCLPFLSHTYSRGENWRGDLDSNVNRRILPDCESSHLAPPQIPSLGMKASDKA